MTEYSCITCGVFSPERYCDEHKPAPRPSFRARGYGATYDRNRRRLFAGKPTCQVKGCTTAAKIAHHIVPKTEGGTDDLSNLMAVCQRHHNALTAAESGPRLRRAGRVDPRPSIRRSER